MANNYYDATGVLVLDQVTPVITALFGRFKLDASYPGNGQAYIAHLAETNDPQWDDVLTDLITVAAQLDLPAPGCDAADREDSVGSDDGNDSEPTVGAILGLLAGHFGADDNADLLNLIEHAKFEDSIDLDALFLIATCFDDGHNLQEIRLEGCWYCSKPRLFEFGSDGRFMSRELEMSSTSTRAIGLGSALRTFLVDDRINDAAKVLDLEVRRLLAGVTDNEQRRQLQQHLAVLLHENLGELVAPAP
jgi:hypothetical protein